MQVAAARLHGLLARVKEKYQDQVSDLTETWNDNTLSFSFKTYGFQVSGDVFVQDDEVVLDGQMVCSCLVLAPEAEGRQISTIEGVAEGGMLHPVQRKFLEHGALQCGFCTPGFIMASKALLDRNPNPIET